MNVLSAEQRSFYDENGWLLLDRIVPASWLGRLRAAVDEISKRTRSPLEVGVFSKRFIVSNLLLRFEPRGAIPVATPR